MAHRRSSPRHRGVSLVEALVALAIMAFGMLSLIGVQGTMRLNSDLAKQRSEATRIATEEIELLRGFTSISVVTGQPGVSYDEIASRTVEAYQPPGAIGNTSYRVERTVSLVGGTQQKVVMVRVLWDDRTGTRQTVTMDSVISGTDPVLSGLLSVPARPSASNQRNGRHNSIPPSAVDQGDGNSRFTPAGSSGIAWYFNNLTGLMRVCNSAGGDCALATLVSGTVQFHRPASGDALNGTSSEVPQGPALNLAAGPYALTLASPVGSGTAASCFAATASATAVNYFCAVVPSTMSGWGGQLNLRLLDDAGAVATFGSGGSQFKSCRYTMDLPSVDNPTTTTINEADPNADFTLNADHPKTYCMENPGTSTVAMPCTGKRVTGNLINQNFLVIRGDKSCPGDDSSTPLINGNTRQHQP